jgi:hypothetical protein
MLTPALLFTIWSASFTIIFGIAAMTVRRQAIHSKSIASVDRVRRSFAEARIKLFGLVTSKKLSPESATFRYLYFLNTSVMRRQDIYEDMYMMEVFVYIIPFLQIKESIGDHQIQLEASQWSSEVREVVLETVDAIQLMMYERPRPLRWLATIKHAIINSWSSDSEVAKLDIFFVANTLKNISPINLPSDSQNLRNFDPKIK